MPELHAAAYQGDANGVRTRLDQYQDDINSFALGRTTALMFAAKRHRRAVICLLVERGCDLNIVNRDGEDALSILFASFPYSSLSLLRFLLEKGAIPHSQRHRGLLGWAIQKGQIDLVEMILRRNPEFSSDVEGPNDLPVLHSVVRSFQSLFKRRILSLLLDHGADPFHNHARHGSAWALAQRLRKDGILQKFRSLENGVWLYSVSRILQKTDRPAPLEITAIPLSHDAPPSQKMVQESLAHLNYSLLQELAMLW